MTELMMNGEMRETDIRTLLKEARNALRGFHDWPDMNGLISRIDSALAAPEPGAMEIAEQIRNSKIGWDGFYYTEYNLPLIKAAALIEQYGRRVPLKMLIDVWMHGQGCDAADFNDQYVINDAFAIAARYGVRIEEVGE